MNALKRKYHEVVIKDDPQQRRRVAMEENGQFHVMVIENKKHDTEIFSREQLRLVESVGN
jgi:hypothetical protein